MLKDVVADILGGKDEVIGFVGAGVGVENVDTRGLDVWNDVPAVGQVESAGVLVVKGYAEEYREVLAYYLADSLYYFRGEAGAVLGRAAVLVGSAVPLRGKELLDKVSIVRMYLYRVEAALKHKVGGDLVVFQRLLNLFLRYLTAYDIGVIVGRVR